TPDIGSMYFLLARLGDQAAGEVFHLTPEGSLKEVSLRLRAAAVIQGRVIDPEGNPVTGARIWPMAQGEERDSYGSFQAKAAQAVTDASGVFTLPQLPMDPYVLIVTAPGFASLESAPVKPGTDDVELTLSRGG